MPESVIGTKGRTDVPAGISPVADAPSWLAVPAPLALVDEAGRAQWNEAGGKFLARALSGSATTWRRWLAASAASLRISGSRRAELPVPRGGRRVGLVLGPVLDPAGRRLMALETPAADAAEDGGLVETVSTLSHELRTPLASMKSSLDLVLSGETGALNADQERFLHMTIRNIDRLERLVGDLLDTSRADAGQLPLRLRNLDLGPVLREAAELHAQNGRSSGLWVDIDGLPETFAALADPDLVLRMLSNLASNALKFTPVGGRVWIRLEAGSEEPGALPDLLAARFGLPLATYRLEVSDDGPGMSRQVLRTICRPFQRGHDETAIRVAGSGLGLHITRGLAAACGGSLRIRSEVGRGTRVGIRLPRDRESFRLLTACRTVAPVEPDGGTEARATDRRHILALDLRGKRIGADGVRAFLDEATHGPELRAPSIRWAEPANDLWIVAVVDPAAWNENWRGRTADRIPAAGTIPAWESLASVDRASAAAERKPNSG